MAEKTENNDSKDLTFEQAIKKLTDIVGKIENGSISLEQSLAQYEQGMDLIKHCRGILQKAEKKIEEISKNGICCYLAVKYISYDLSDTLIFLFYSDIFICRGIFIWMSR